MDTIPEIFEHNKKDKPEFMSFRVFENALGQSTNIIEVGVNHSGNEADLFDDAKRFFDRLKIDISDEAIKGFLETYPERSIEDRRMANDIMPWKDTPIWSDPELGVSIHLKADVLNHESDEAPYGPEYGASVTWEKSPQSEAPQGDSQDNKSSIFTIYVRPTGVDPSGSEAKKRANDIKDAYIGLLIA